MTAATGAEQSLSHGLLGQALLLAVQAHDDPAAAVRLHELLAGLGPVVDGPDAGPFHGSPAVAYVMHLAPSGYLTALERLDEVNEALTRQRLTAAHRRLDQGRLACFAEYDLLRGLTGLGVLWLLRGTRPNLLHDVLAYLIRLSGSGADGRPLWRVWHRPDDPESNGAHVNNGLAHGIAGPLALLALAHRRGARVPGHHEAVRRIMDHLDTVRHHDQLTWWDRWDGENLPSPPPPSWCYGTPGLTRAQQLAALALGDPRLQEDVERALLSCLRSAGPLREPTVCHGSAGLTAVLRRVAGDSLQPGRFQDHIHVPTDTAVPQGGGLLDGATGVALARRETSLPWDACLALI
jgi:lantibiotic biosynthesis protein